jgi:hypothetical protein
MAARKRMMLKVIGKPTDRSAIDAPPILVASDHTIDYFCGVCWAVLMHADDGQVHNLAIHCTDCGAFNSTDP